MVLEVQADEAIGLAKQSIPLERGLCTLGRGSENPVRIDHPTVSSLHAELRIEEGRLFVLDRDSTNGLFFRGQRQTAFWAVPGDSFRVGRVMVRLAGDGAVSAAGEPLTLDAEARSALHTEIVTRLNRSRTDLAALSAEELEPRARETAAALLLERFGGQGAALLDDVLSDVLGLGPLDALLKDDTVSEIMVNGPERIYVEKGGRLYLSGRVFLSERQVRDVIERIVLPLGRRIDESSPVVDARLADGSRVNAVIPPLALNGPVLTIRKFSRRRLTPDDLLRFGSASPAMIDYLRFAVENRRNILVSGGTGSGKTTLLNILSSFIPRDERIITIEDAAELRLDQDHVVSLETRPSNVEGRGEVTVRDLVRNALRMRPDRIIVGECRGGEALDMLQAMNTGHDGSMTTGHANTPVDMLRRLETMVLMSGVDLPVRAVREQIASAVHLVVQQSRLADGSRRIVSVVKVCGLENEALRLAEIFRYSAADSVFLDLRVPG